MDVLPQPLPELEIEFRGGTGIDAEFVIRSRRYHFGMALRLDISLLAESRHSPDSILALVRGRFLRTQRGIQSCGLSESSTGRLLQEAFRLTGNEIIQSLQRAARDGRLRERPTGRHDDLADAHTFTEPALPAAHQALRAAQREMMEYDRAMLERLRFDIMGGAAPALRDADAERRAIETLKGCLTQQQLEQINRDGSFVVRVPPCVTFRDGRELEINANEIYNVRDPESGVRYCAAPAGNLPTGDRMLAQKLVLENDPMQFFRFANAKDRSGALIQIAASNNTPAELHPPRFEQLLMRPHNLIEGPLA